MPDMKREPRRPFAWRALTSVMISVASVLLLASGIVLFLAPPGRVANWTDWAIFSLRKDEWAALHVSFSSLFVVLALAHVFFNWRPLVSYFKDRLTRRIGFRREWLVAFALCGVVFLGTRKGAPPFSWLLAWSETLKESWEQPDQRAPIPHAELLTLAELANEAQVPFSLAQERWASQGITNHSADLVVRDVAQSAGMSAQRVFQVMVAEPSSTHGGTGQRSSDAGGGMGRKTLAEFCQAEGIELTQALDRLKAQDLEADADMTLREMALQNGLDRPIDLLVIIRGEGDPALME